MWLCFCEGWRLTLQVPISRLDLRTLWHLDPVVLEEGSGPLKSPFSCWAATQGRGRPRLSSGPASPSLSWLQLSLSRHFREHGEGDGSSRVREGEPGLLPLSSSCHLWAAHYSKRSRGRASKANMGAASSPFCPAPQDLLRHLGGGGSSFILPTHF